MNVLIVEDQLKDLRVATRAAEDSGFSGVEARSSAESAVSWLQKGLAGEVSLPDAIVLDIDLGFQSGFELLRYWHSDPRLARIPLVVWTVLGDHYREICRMFKVKAYVEKGQDVSVLQQVLRGLSGVPAQ
jgi:CheY-like chemotaxis protein